MRIIEVISDTNIGGAGVLLCERLACRNPLRDSTLVLLPHGSALSGRLRECGACALEMSMAPDTSFCLRDIRKFAEIFRAYRPHVVNTHASLSARIAAFLCTVPVKICTRHCVFEPTIAERLLSRPASLLCDRFIAVAECAAQQLADLGVPRSKISVVINGARALPRIPDDEKREIKEGLCIPNDAAVLIMCARLEAYKGHDCLLRALQILNERGERVVALFAGEGSEKENLIRLTKGMNIEKSVRFLGFCKNVAPYFNISDINVNCSYGTETSALSLGEGMSIGLPSVVSDYGGNTYMVRDGENGFVFRQKNEFELAERICRLIHNRELYEKMSQAALLRYKNELNINISAKKTNAVYRECISEYRNRKSKL